MAPPNPEPTATPGDPTDLAALPDLAERLRAAGCVFAEDEAAALREAGASAEELEAMTVRRIAGEPLEQVLGWALFAGLRIRVRPGVFVPRRRSELMVRLAAARLRPGEVLLDLGCGSGAIAAAVADRVPDAEVWAVDVDPAAVACARLNLPEERVLLGDLYDPLPSGLRAQVICANAPYVPSDAIRLMPPEAREHEHRVALDGGPDGLAVQRRVIAAAHDHLAEDGMLLIETGRTQAALTVAVATTAGLDARLHLDDEVDGTVVEARVLGPRAEEVAHPPTGGRPLATMERPRHGTMTPFFQDGRTDFGLPV